MDRHFDFEDPLAGLYHIAGDEPSKHVKVLPPTADRLAKLDAAYERVMGGSVHGSTPHLDSHLSLGLDDDIGSSVIRSVGAMQIDEASSVLSAIDRRLNIIGLKSQREKAAFLSSIGA
jgi:hypothetical protein